MGKWIALGLLGIILDAIFAFASVKWWHIPVLITVPIAGVALVLLIVVVCITWGVDAPEERRENHDRDEREVLEARNQQEQRFESDRLNRASHRVWPVQVPHTAMSKGYYGRDRPEHLYGEPLKIPPKQAGDVEYDNRVYGIWDGNGNRL